ncbi:MAG: glycosyltransferase family 2 protein [Myxococcales bacterium]|nr:glycosyltransferase family 2 protein [Myxococcales bacterium]
MRLLLIIPAFNEQASLGGLLAEIKALPTQAGVQIEAVVVDDGSSDRTQEVARAHGARVLRLCRNLGIGGAVQAGIQLAHREGFDAAVQMDGDGQHPPAELQKLLAPVTGGDAPDLVVGTRYRDGASQFRSTMLRRLGSAWLRGILRLVTRLRISDPTSGFRLYGARALRLFSDTYPYDFPEPESLAMARAAGLAVIEVPIAMRERQGGQSSISGYTSIYYMFKVTVAVVLAYLRTNRRARPDEAPDAVA